MFSSGERVAAASGSDVLESREAVYTRGRFLAHDSGQRRILSTSAREEGGESPEEATRKAVAGRLLSLRLTDALPKNVTHHSLSKIR